MEEFALIVLLLTLLALPIVWAIALAATRRRRIVSGTSTAIAALRQVNQTYLERLHYYPPLSYKFFDTVNSKSKLDRYSLHDLLLERLAAHESEIQQGLEARLSQLPIYAEYASQVESIRKELGRSRSERVRADRYDQIELSLFNKEKLPAPQCDAEVICLVTYTSPKGQNTYTKHAEWTFDQLAFNLMEMRRIRELRSTAEFKRRQERNKMTARMRAEILKRDKSRCQMCGTSAAEGARLHIDHIKAIANGGTTTPENLQTLCQDCNLGKSNVL